MKTYIIEGTVEEVVSVMEQLNFKVDRPPRTKEPRHLRKQREANGKYKRQHGKHMMWYKVLGKRLIHHIRDEMSTGKPEPVIAEELMESYKGSKDYKRQRFTTRCVRKKIKDAISIARSNAKC